MQAPHEQETQPESLKTALNKPFFICEHVKKPRFVYKAGYNYTENSKTSVNLYISREFTEADLYLFYELRASWIKFDRIQVAKLVIYRIPKISFNYLKQLCYEFNK